MSLIAIDARINIFIRSALYTAVATSLLLTPARACLTDCAVDVYFTGTWADETCTVEVNNASSNETVFMPTIEVSSLQQNGSEARSVPFDITLKECPASRTITVFFNSSVSAADTATGNLVNDTGTGLSSNVQIRLRKENSSQVLIDDASTGQDYVISSTADPVNHRFTASYYAKGNQAVSAGQVRAVAGVELVYR